MTTNALISSGAGQTIGEMVSAVADVTPDTAALLSHGRSALTYQALAQEIQRVQVMLNGWGVGRGDRVALVIGPRAEALLAYLCVASAATVIPLNPKATPAELRAALTQTKADAVIVSAGLAGANMARDLGLTTLRLDPNPGEAAGTFQLAGGTAQTASLPGPAAQADIATILMTSGTTSTPKVVPLSHALVIRRGACEAAAFGLTADDRCHNFRPPHLHGALNAGLMAPLSAGGGVVVPDDFDANAFYRDLRDLGVTWYTGGPAHHAALLERAHAYREIIANSSLRLIRSASYRLSPELMQRLETTFGAICLERYGGTEAGLISRNPPPPGHRKPGTAGLPFGNEVAIFDQAGGRLPAGEQGEIVARGPNVFSGYQDGATAAAAPRVDGWYRTGDLGGFDEDGYLKIFDRISEVINRGGQKVSPEEVEAALTKHAAVRDCICFPIPHGTLGQVVGAAVVLREGTAADERALQAHVRSQLAQFKVPSRIVQCDELPRGPGGKPQRLIAAARLGLAAAQPQIESPVTETLTSERSVLVSALAALWCDHLALDSIGDDDNFIMMGGDSLRAARLCADAEVVFGVRLPPGIIFGEGATLHGMARVIAAQRN